MSQEVKNSPFAAKLFIFTKVNFIEWFNEIYELAIHGWQILWQISSTTPIVCWTRWNLLPWYILKQLTMCKLPETRVKCTFNTFDSWNYLPSELFLWRQNMLWNDQEREYFEKSAFSDLRRYITLFVLFFVLLSRFFHYFSRSVRLFECFSNNFENILQPPFWNKEINIY